MFNHQKIIVFDFETTGLNPEFDQIIEIGAIVLEKQTDGHYEITQELQKLVRSHRPLPLKIIEITKITDEMLLRYGVSQEEAFMDFFKIYEDNALLIAYNIQFDLSFLNAYFKRYWNPSFSFKNDILDVMAIYKDRHKFPHRLESAVAHYQIELPNTHRALDDVKATLNVLKEMHQEKPNLIKYVNVIGFNPNYGVSGLRLPHVRYIGQYGARLEIEKS
jgi:DNA polymerase III subunit epsilon